MATKRRKILNYPEEQLQRAVVAVKEGMSVRKASKIFEIPKSTLSDKVSDKRPGDRKIGAPTVLPKQVERNLADWVLECADKWNRQVTKDQLLDSVEVLCKNMNLRTSFALGRPGYAWYTGFLKRHPEIKERIAENNTLHRVSMTRIFTLTDFPKALVRLFKMC